MSEVNPSNFVTDIVTFSYANVFEPKLNPSGKLKYSACLLLDKTNSAEKARWDACIDAAIQLGIKQGKFTANQRPILKTPIRDGDEELKTGIKKEESYKGRYFVNANSDNPPGVTKPQGGVAVPIADPLEFYSGCKGRAIITFYPYSEGGSRGIAVGLNGVYKVADGDRLDGRVNASAVFSQFAEADGDLEAGEDTGAESPQPFE
ncbi:MAG: DUF2815 family protein [Spirochaetaceae bacterium]